MIDRAIRVEFIIGKDKLNRDIASFFRGDANRILNIGSNSKMQWLASTWDERDRVRADKGLSTWYKEPLAEAFLIWHRMQKKRRRKEDFAAL